jgi:ribosomal protein S18 acetylase RimI-like enzyme
MTNQKMIVRAATPEDAVVCGQIAVEAWTPVRKSMCGCIGEDIYHLFGDQKEQKRLEVIRAFNDNRIQVLVTEIDGHVVGFITCIVLKNNNGVRFGEIGNNAVDPLFGGKGIGTFQCQEMISRMKEQGVAYIQVDTGLDESHAPARRMYEKAGFDRSFEYVTYYMKT